MPTQQIGNVMTDFADFIGTDGSIDWSQVDLATMLETEVQREDAAAVSLASLLGPASDVMVDLLASKNRGALASVLADPSQRAAAHEQMGEYAERDVLCRVTDRLTALAEAVQYALDNLTSEHVTVVRSANGDATKARVLISAPGERGTGESASGSVSVRLDNSGGDLGRAFREVAPRAKARAAK